METLRLKPRQPVAEPDIEDWDDDDFQIDNDDLTFRTTSTTANLPPSRRDSASSHVSLRSDLESILDEETHVHVPGDDEKSTLDAIAAATQAGIPIPKNVPSSALMGGTIKRLGGRKIKKIMQDDWEDDLVLPESSQGLRIKPQDGSKFPDMLRQVSGGSNHTSPTKPMRTPPAVSLLDRRESTESTTSTLSGTLNLEKFRDNDDDDDFFGDGSETIKVSKIRSLKHISLITPPTPQKSDKTLDDDFENDFELPSDGKLKLSTRKDIPKTPLSHAEDLDWGEGSLGTRFGGTRRDGFSNRSSSVSAMSPSVSSSFTVESEDETFDGLVLPSGPVNFEERLSRRKLSRSPVRAAEKEPPNLKTPQPRNEPEPEDMFDGLDVGDGDVFSSGKLTLHRNIRVNANRPPSPVRPKTAISLTFSSKTTPSRLPRPSHERHERTLSALEPVSESGGPIFARSRRSQSRMGHASQSSVTSIHSMPTPTTPSPVSLLPSTPRRRELGPRTSTTSLRNEPTTTSSQLLRFKRSLPAMKASHSPAKPNSSRFERPPSRTDLNRPSSVMRPKTPTERSRPAVESHAAQQRRPFLPAGASQSQSQHVTAKTSRTFRRHDSENSLDLRPTSRAFSRSTMRSPSPKRLNRHSDHITHDGLSFRTLTKPHRNRNFGDGHELDAFDDLPTSAQSEAKFVRQPMKAPLRNKLYQNVLPDRTNTPSPAPYSPAKADYTPHFARDTQASRIARETSLAQRAPSGPLAPLTLSRVSQLSSRNNFNPGLPQATVRSKKKRNPPQLKPHLISNMNKDKTPQHLQGMFYNPDTFCWEGNENVLNAFDPPASSPATASVPHPVRDKEASTPRPALITNISHTKGVQVVKGMVFDPQNMCWLKMGPQTNPKSEIPDPMDDFNALDDDEDVFKDIPDLDDNPGDPKEPGRVSEVQDEWLVGEEFDVGPEFVRRQREEEDRWRRKCEKWLDVGNRDRDAWRWAIRDILLLQRATQ
ncbi:cytokinesis regulator [Colletotrichum tabaci]|uniref:Cytokinesis regulator n=1 Tax=Colletotrichum tabaci TaxID=1209068 RepID=A0AAV9TSD0_9PEZI